MDFPDSLVDLFVPCKLSIKCLVWGSISAATCFSVESDWTEDHQCVLYMRLPRVLTQHKGTDAFPFVFFRFVSSLSYLRLSFLSCHLCLSYSFFFFVLHGSAGAERIRPMVTLLSTASLGHGVTLSMTVPWSIQELCTTTPPGMGGGGEEEWA